VAPLSGTLIAAGLEKTVNGPKPRSVAETRFVGDSGWEFPVVWAVPAIKLIVNANVTSRTTMNEEKVDVVGTGVEFGFFMTGYSDQRFSKKKRVRDLNQVDSRALKRVGTAVQTVARVLVIHSSHNTQIVG